MSLSEKILRSVKWFASIAFLLLSLILALDALFLMLVGHLPSSHPETFIGTFFLAANCALPITTIILLAIFLSLGIPTYSRCPKCLCRFRWKDTFSTGPDKSQPDRYEHSFETTECLVCGKTDTFHFKREKTCRCRHDFDSHRNHWQ
jgi:predicted nucleic-acid-binding Zn-ribbon protein